MWEAVSASVWLMVGGLAIFFVARFLCLAGRYIEDDNYGLLEYLGNTLFWVSLLISAAAVVTVAVGLVRFVVAFIKYLTGG